MKTHNATFIRLYLDDLTLKGEVSTEVRFGPNVVTASIMYDDDLKEQYELLKKSIRRTYDVKVMNGEEIFYQSECRLIYVSLVAKDNDVLSYNVVLKACK